MLRAKSDSRALFLFESARQFPGTSVVGQQVEESLSHFLPCERLGVLQAVQQRADGVILSLPVHRTHSVPVRKLAFSEKVQNVPSGWKQNRRFKVIKTA